MKITITTLKELPEYCYQCPCCDSECGYCKADKDERRSEYRPFWCPLSAEKENDDELYVTLTVIKAALREYMTNHPAE